VLAVYVSAAVTPGPNVLLVIRTAAVSRRAAIAAAVGVVSAGACLAAAAAFGLGAVLARSPWLERGLRWCCGGYLVYLGVVLFSGARTPLVTAGAAAGTAPWTAYRRGLLTNLTNPKAAVFFGSILTGMLPASVPGTLRAAAVVLIVGCSAAWHLTLAVAFSTRSAQRWYARAKTALNRAVGTLLALFGIGLVVGVS
jgi:threonine/homoserine/homoserine lactone efflux protein